ncbi:hypothetical protein C8R47DRAFT_1011434 [Mycena vitilis]|nr:hypothetical protein C8R47DRAFT_1011434 [Mycena vitilis]
MSSAASPLRDRLLSNSPDPAKTRILRESGMGWSDNNGRVSPNVSPLRISKRDSPQRRPPPSELARRNSSSFKHVTKNNLVSKSPFKSQIPTPATATPRQFPSPTRRVSGEKRPRPQSIHDQAEAENDRPFAFKRERRQSKTFQGLIQKEVVSKSPFRQQEDPNAPQERPPIPPIPPTPSRIPVPSTAPSPGRSSLVSKRMHGPRLSGRRERRKTVTFDERCDVVEFDREEDPSDDSADDYGHDYGQDDDDTPDADDPFFVPPQQQDAQPPQPDSSYESIDLSDTSLLPESSLPLDLDPDTSITGLVDAMFGPASGTSTPPPQLGSAHTRTFEVPPHEHEHEHSRDNDHATDLDTEDGVPFGRSHHAERAAAFHEHEAHPPPVPLPHLNSSGGARPLPLPAGTRDGTPPRSRVDSSVSTPPLGRTTHFERRRAAAEDHEDYDEDQDEVDEADIERMPGSPSPAPARHADLVEIGVPRFSLPSGRSFILSTALFTDGITQAVGPTPRIRLCCRGYATSRCRTQERTVAMSVWVCRLRRWDFYLILWTRLLTNYWFSPRTSTRARAASRVRCTAAAGARASAARRCSAACVRGARAPSRRTIRWRRIARRSGPSRDETRDEDEFREEREEEARFEEREAEARFEEHEREQELSRSMTASMEMEVSTVEVAERVLPQTPTLTEQHQHRDAELGLRAPDLGLDFGSRFGLGGLGIPGLSGSVGSRMSGMSSGSRAAERREPERMAVDMDMRSALDRLMDDVGGEVGDDSVRTEADTEESLPPPAHPRVPVRAATDSALLQLGEGALSRTVSVASSSSLLSLPPPVPPKDNIRSREAIIIEKRREMRRFDEGDYDYTPAPVENTQYLRAGTGRPSGRRSMSTGDAEELTRLRGKGLLDVGAGKDDLLGDSIEKELTKLEEPHKRVRKYHIRQHDRMIYASSSETDRISHMAGAGDVDAGKAWRAVRRPSDMNEYSKQIKEYRAQQNPGKAYGKVFVKVLGVRGMHLPVPAEPTAVTCTLNNGIHFVTTPECALARDCRIEQEFELIEHSKLEFTLTLKVRRDPHIISQFKAVAPTPAPAPVAPPPPIIQQTSSKGKLRFWASSPKKTHEKVAAPPPLPAAPMPKPPQMRLPENLARYLKPDGTLARAFISFKDISVRCDTRLFETNYPLIGQRAELGGKASTLQVGELVLQMFRLPPLPGIPPDQLPQSLEECHRGLRHINWHKVTYFQGTLTQNGGDCSTWRRRQLRVIGSNLVAFNDVTKKATATIDLKKAVAVEDDQEARGAMSPASAMTARSSRYDEYDGLYGVERSFRLIFPNDQEIVFFADTDEEKAKWLEVLRALVGHIPPHPLWAELLWQRQEELSKRVPLPKS